MDYKGSRLPKPAGLLTRAPRLRVSCKRHFPRCCAKERDHAWRKFRRKNRDYCRKGALLEVDPTTSIT